MDSLPTTGEVDASSTASAATDVTGAPTTGDDITPLCVSLCSRSEECMLGTDPAGCTSRCVDDFHGIDGACENATEAYLECLLELTCEQLEAIFSDDDPGPCIQQVKDVGVNCSDATCSADVASSPNGTECDVSLTCPNQPILSMQCDTDTCMCFAGNAVTGMCQANNTCMDLANASNQLLDCCGF